MSISVKIRVLLAVLCASLIFAAIAVRSAYTPQDNLNQLASTLEAKLHKKESWVNTFLSSGRYGQLKTINRHEQAAIQLIDELIQRRRLWLLTLQDNKIVFWSGIKVMPANPAAIKEGVSFLKEPNGYYEVIRKSEGSFSAVFFIPVKNEYALQNTYLRNTFDQDLLQDTNLALADINDTQIHTITNSSHQYLFSVKLKQPGKLNSAFLGFELLLWISGLITLCLLVNLTATYCAIRGRVWQGILLITGFAIIMRLVNLQWHYPHIIYELDLFSPAFYHAGYLFPSLGDFCLNILLLSWIAAFVYHYRNKLLRRKPSLAVAYIIAIIGTLSIAYLLTQLLNLFSGLVINTSINFNVNNILNLSAFSMLAVFILCFCLLSVFLFSETLLAVNKKLNIPTRHAVYIVIGTMLLLTAASTWQHHIFTLLFILWAVIVLIRGYAARYNNGQFEPLSFLSIIIAFALIVAVKFTGFQSIREKGLRIGLIKQLENANDTVTNQLFKTIETRIAADPVLADYFMHRTYDADYLKTYLQTHYFDGYLAGYNLKVNEFDADGKPMAAGNQYALTDFKDLVLYSSFKVSDYFYRENNAFGFKSYFAIIPVYRQGTALGTIIVDLKSKPLQFNYSYPQVLVNNRLRNGNEFKDYSYAFYNNGVLQSQNGKYLYNTVNNTFTGRLKNYVFTTTAENNGPQPWYKHTVKYNHLIYQPSQRKLIVVSREDDDMVNSTTTLTFFFIVLLTFAILLFGLVWLWSRVKLLSIKNNRLIWKLRVRFDRLLYKTRIQLFMIIAVVVTLILVGVVTFLSIQSQYIDQQDNMMIDKAARVAAAFEASQLDKLQQPGGASQMQFNTFADNFSADMALFDLNGVPLLTTQPKIYDYGLLGRRMNGRAYIQLHNLQKSVIVNDEKIGALNFKSAYAPIRNSKNVTIGYLQLPYFSNEADYKERMGALLNAMINIYALIFIVIGLLAVLIARQITAPLNFIQQSLSRTVYGRKNEPINWHGDDEIGALVKEYNQMIAALEHSANRLAQSERESAWREMAKQVAHEIKNPLTPLKLGLQLLEKSWKDQDPKFDQKFQRFSKSFVEQIESLATIASEFSAFAKMPDTRMEKVNILELLGQAVTIFKHMDNVTINYQPADERFMIMGDRDQLLRCFNNLLKNAIEAMPQDRPGIIDIDYTISQHSILLRIKDNGNGIPENLRERIFEPNFTTKSSGTGLGLAFVKNSIENTGGKVWFETETGAGTTFFLNFPKPRFISQNV